MDEINNESIDKLMEVFYEKIRKDKNGLGDIFNKIIGTDNQSWVHHKAKIATFWRSILLGDKEYQGFPLKVHLELEPFKRELFNVWLELFSASLDEVFESSLHKEKILERANMIASRFQKMLYEFPHN